MKIAALHAKCVKQESRYQAYSVVASVLSAFLAGSAHLAGVAQIAKPDLSQIKTGRNAFCVKRVSGVVQSALTIFRPAKTVLLEDTRL